MSEQIILPDPEKTKLEHRIEEDFLAAIADHTARMNRWEDYYQRWRIRYDSPDGEDQDKPNFRVPLVKWHVTAKLAKEVEALFGDDAEIVAQPTGPSDLKRAKKVALYMTWRIFRSMRIVKKFITFALRKILFGRSVAYAPWAKQTFKIPVTRRLSAFIFTITGGRLGQQQEVEATDYEGPLFEPLWPDDFIVPAEECESLHDFTFVIRRYIEPASEFIDKIGTIYQDNSEDQSLPQEIVDMAFDADRDTQNQQVRDESERGEGVTKRNSQSARDGVTIWEWYGKRRMLNPGEEDADENDLSKRDTVETELVARYAPELKRLVGLQNLAEIYPLVKKRRPFVESAMPGDGYFPPGFGELLAEIESEVSATNNLGVEAGQYSVGPLVFYRPGSGVDPERRKYEPFEMIPSDNPGQDVNVVTFNADLTWPQNYTQFLMGLAERLGVGDLNLGRTQDRPNAPRTVGQTVALLDESNVRFALDNRVFREDFAEIIRHFWGLEIMFLQPKKFFRVTEEQADGLFPVADGGAYLMTEDRSGSFDFDIKLATSAINKEVSRQRALELFQLDMQNPLIVTNPVALWKATDRLHKAMGDDDFAALIPEPPEPDRSRKPSEELVMLMQREPITVSPLDQDELHVSQHQQQIQWLAQQQPIDERTIEGMQQHIAAHISQIQEKAFMEQLARRTAQQVGEALGQGINPGDLVGDEANGTATATRTGPGGRGSS